MLLSRIVILLSNSSQEISNQARPQEPLHRVQMPLLYPTPIYSQLWSQRLYCSTSEAVFFVVGYLQVRSLSDRTGKRLLRQGRVER